MTGIRIRGSNYSETVTLEAYIRKLPGIPEQYRIVSIITIGHHDSHRTGKLYEESPFEKIRNNRF